MRTKMILFLLLFLLACQSTDQNDDFVKASSALQEEIDSKIESIPYLHGSSLTAVLTRLTYIGEPAIPSLLKALESRDVLTRSSAAFVLGQIGFRHQKIYDALRKSTKDPVPTVRYESGASLLSMGDVYGAGVLIEGLKDKEMKNRFVSIVALRECLKKDFGYNPKSSPEERLESIQKWEEWWDRAQREKK